MKIITYLGKTRPSASLLFLPAANYLLSPNHGWPVSDNGHTENWLHPTFNWPLKSIGHNAKRIGYPELDIIQPQGVAQGQALVHEPADLVIELGFSIAGGGDVQKLRRNVQAVGDEGLEKGITPRRSMFISPRTIRLCSSEKISEERSWISCAVKFARARSSGRRSAGMLP